MAAFSLLEGEMNKWQSRVSSENECSANFRWGKVSYELMEYDVNDGLVDGISVAEKTGQAVETVYKTLVTIAGPRELFIFLVPVAPNLI